jgi:hypothetical protein
MMRSWRTVIVFPLSLCRVAAIAHQWHVSGPAILALCNLVTVNIVAAQWRFAGASHTGEVIRNSAVPLSVSNGVKYVSQYIYL